jgi:hypothetical protein
MSAYNDYMTNAGVCFITYAELYCKLLQQGVDDCCLKNKLNILAMFLDTFPRVANGECIESADITPMTELINTLCGYPSWGTLDGEDIVSTPLGFAGTGVVPGIVYTGGDPTWNQVIGIAPTAITFYKTMGATGYSWGMSYIATNAAGYDVAADLVFSNRTANGFTVIAPENGVTFEGSASLVT